MTFEQLIRVAADRGIRGLNVTKRADGKGYEASVRRKDHDAYGVYVNTDPLVAIAGVIMENDEFLTTGPDSAFAVVREAPVVSQQEIDDLI